MPPLHHGKTTTHSGSYWRIYNDNVTMFEFPSNYTIYIYIYSLELDIRFSEFGDFQCSIYVFDIITYGILKQENISIYIYIYIYIYKVCVCVCVCVFARAVFKYEIEWKRKNRIKTHNQQSWFSQSSVVLKPGFPEERLRETYLENHLIYFAIFTIGNSKNLTD